MESRDRLARFLLALFFIASICNLSDSVCPGKENTIEPWSGNLTFVKRSENGALYIAGDAEDELYVLHVYGEPYDMGYAHGVLLRDQVQAIIPAFYDHVKTEIEVYVKDLPKPLQDYIAKVGLDAALDATHLLTEAHTPKYFYSELEGLAKGSGVPYDTLLRVHMLPELVKGRFSHGNGGKDGQGLLGLYARCKEDGGDLGLSMPGQAGCSMLGSWGQSATDSKMMTQLRALDWDTTGPLQDSPAVIVYHPKEGNAFANVGWTGWIATISGMSSKGIAVSEKHSDVPFGEESRIGVPFSILMRDVIQFDSSLYQAMSRIQNAHRTCSIWLGVGDRNVQSFRLVEYSKSTANFYDDRNISSIDVSRFEREGCHTDCYKNYTMPDLVYWGVHLECWEEMLHMSYGQIDPLSVIKLVGTVQTGDLQAVVYDLEEMTMLVSNAKGSKESGPDNAYDRQFVQLDMKAIFQHPKPS